MSIAPGSQLGPYEVRGPLGAGGMGEVYEARDTRLDRTVAIKVLPEHLSQDPARRERFEREARAVSSLNHPHICTLHDVGEQDGVHYLVMERLEGETLAERLKKGPLPLENALETGAQIADALGKAHREGVVHRDLKPGNVMLTKVGVKLLDFGLAKTREPTDVPSEDSEQPTQNKPLTDAGTILGTMQYMAPEQLEGKEVDARADLFSLGAILYEMLTGRKAFNGQSQASLISAIMSAEPPPVSHLYAVSPPALDRAVQRCLEKDPEHRWQNAHDLMSELRWIATTGAGLQTARTNASPGGRRVYAVGSLAVLAIAAAVVGIFLPRGRGAEPVYRVDATIPEQHQFLTFRSASISVSPDGKTIVYAAREDDVIRLYRRSLEEFEVRPLAGTEGARSPFFSPDGAWIGFFAQGAIQKVPLAGGAPLVIAETGAVSPSASWGDDDRILYSLETRSGLRMVPAGGGEAETVTEPRYHMGEAGHRLPQVLPGSEKALFTVRTNEGDYAALLSLQTGEWRLLSEIGRATKARWVASGHLVYVQPESGALMATPFDLEKEAPTGPPAVIVQDELMRTGIDDVFYTISKGSLVYANAGAKRPGLAWLDRKGSFVRLEDRLATHPRESPDRTRLAVDFRTPGRRDVWVLDERGARTRLTRRGTNEFPVWSPDGRFIAFASTQDGSQSLYWTKPDGSSGVEPLFVEEMAVRPTSWSSDGKFLALESSDANDRGRDIWALPVRVTEKGPVVSGELIPLHRGDFDEGGAVFSPDGKWIAYVSMESGRAEVYVESFPDADVRRPISTTGGSEPMWSHDGTELFYRNGNAVMAVPVTTDDGIQVGDAVHLFDAPDASFSTHAHYDVSSDGEHFIMRWDDVAPPSRLRVVLNWTHELELLGPSER